MKEFVKSLTIILLIVVFFLMWTGLDIELVDEEINTVPVPCSRVLASKDSFTPAEYEYCAKLVEETN